MGLPIGQVGGSSGKDFREKIVGQEEGSHARTDGHASQITEGAASNRAENVVGKILGWDGLFARRLQNVNLVVKVVVKVTGHRGWVDGTDIDTQGLQLNV